MKLAKIALTIGTILIASTAWAQGRRPLSIEEKRQNLVSASAGEINYVEGDVKAKIGGAEWDIVTVGDSLKTGDSLRTGQEAHAEVLLSPGSYLRLSGNTEFQFRDTSLDNLKLQVLKGSAIIEAGVDDSSGRFATVITPKNEFVINRKGVYRINVDADGSSRLIVEKGKMQIGEVQVKEGKEATVGEGGAVAVASFNRDSQDEFDTWSKERAASLAEANLSLTNHPSFLSSVDFLRFPFRPCSGLWLFNPFFGSFVYLPDAFDSCSPLSSAYGFYYGYCNPYSYAYYGPRGGYAHYPGDARRHPRTGPWTGNGKAVVDPRVTAREKAISSLGRRVSGDASGSRGGGQISNGGGGRFGSGGSGRGYSGPSGGSGGHSSYSGGGGSSSSHGGFSGGSSSGSSSSSSSHSSGAVPSAPPSTSASHGKQ